MEEVIKTNALTKQYGNTVAVDDLSIHVNRGEIYGFLGLNGAGKTTLIRMLLGMIKPQKGEVMLFQTKLSDFNLWNKIGYLVETPYSYPNLSVYENLKVYYDLRQLNNRNLIDEIIANLKLEKYQHIKASALSLGNKQRLGLAKALMHKPKLLILDEPINGLDPEGIVEIRDLLKTLSQNGSTIFLSTHLLGEISKLANRIGIIHEGKLIKEITINELNEQLTKKIIIKTINNQATIRYLSEMNYQTFLNPNDEIEVFDDSAIHNPEKISKLLVENGISLQEMYLFTEDLEKFFLRTIKNQSK